MNAPGYGPDLNTSVVRLGLNPHYITAFDSSSALLRALGRFLHGRDFPALGMANMLKPLTFVLDKFLSERMRVSLFRLGGRAEAIRPSAIGHFRSDEVDRWVVSYYPKRRYPAIMIGSTNGAGMHLCAALGIPWLPQTSLVLLRHHGVSPDDPKGMIEAGRDSARRLLKANPGLQLHQMCDPVQDRLMSREALYFRLKRLTLGETYARFIQEFLEPNGTIILFESGPQWPTSQIGERHIFQWGGLGTLSPSEYVHGSERVEIFLRANGCPRSHWDVPAPDGERPEAEWGFEPSLSEDVEELAARRGFRIHRMAFDHPEHASPLVADLYRWWYEERGIPSRLLVAESFFLVEPWWMLRTGAVPFWLSFNTEASANFIESYLDQTSPFDEIRVMLFSNGIDAAGLADIKHWERVLARAAVQGDFLGVNADRYPKDFETFIRYHTEFKKITPRHPMPPSLSLDQLSSFLEMRQHRT